MSVEGPHWQQKDSLQCRLPEILLTGKIEGQTRGILHVTTGTRLSKPCLLLFSAHLHKLETYNHFQKDLKWSKTEFTSRCVAAQRSLLSHCCFWYNRFFCRFRIQRKISFIGQENVTRAHHKQQMLFPLKNLLHCISRVSFSSIQRFSVD